MIDLKNRITTNPNQCGGRPSVRGMRIRVVNMLDLLATGPYFPTQKSRKIR